MKKTALAFLTVFMFLLSLLIFSSALVFAAETEDREVLPEDIRSATCGDTSGDCKGDKQGADCITKGDKGRCKFLEKAESGSECICRSVEKYKAAACSDSSGDGCKGRFPGQPCYKYTVAGQVGVESKILIGTCNSVNNVCSCELGESGKIVPEYDTITRDKYNKIKLEKNLTKAEELRKQLKKPGLDENICCELSDPKGTGNPSYVKTSLNACGGKMVDDSLCLLTQTPFADGGKPTLLDKILAVLSAQPWFAKTKEGGKGLGLIARIVPFEGLRQFLGIIGEEKFSFKPGPISIN